MKRTIILLAIFLFTLSFNNTDARGVKGSYGFFYNSLAPHGEWIELDNDLVVWRPNQVHYNWQPYTVGRWSWTNYGWYWDSYEPFGWATYHYGRWFYDNYYGWVWMPDDEWGPAWVEWRYDDNYIGWAPLSPHALFSITLGISFTNQHHSHYRHWHYVGYNNFCDKNVNKHIIYDNRKINRIHRHTKHVADYEYRSGRIINRGIDRNRIESRSGRKVVKNDLNIKNKTVIVNNRTVNKNRIDVYRPTKNEIKTTKTDRTTVIKKSESVTRKNKRNVIRNDRTATRKDQSVDRTNSGREVRKNSQRVEPDTKASTTRKSVRTNSNREVKSSAKVRKTENAAASKKRSSKSDSDNDSRTVVKRR
ncbi:MAG: hypothetical protein JEY94_08835 [Melioribacteraceae bacterium]|nr:hypothetical protein [Melioribacteraceae bacterium]